MKTRFGSSEFKFSQRHDTFKFRDCKRNFLYRVVPQGTSRKLYLSFKKKISTARLYCNISGKLVVLLLKMSTKTAALFVKLVFESHAENNFIEKNNIPVSTLL